MTSEHFNDVVKERIEKCLSIICKKAKEYANDTDRLRAFKAAAAIEKTSATWRNVGQTHRFNLRYAWGCRKISER